MLKRIPTFLLIFACGFILIYGCAGNKGALKKNALVHLQLAASLFSEGDTITALDELLKARDLDPDDPQVYNMLGLV